MMIFFWQFVAPCLTGLLAYQLQHIARKRFNEWVEKRKIAKFQYTISKGPHHLVRGYPVDPWR